MKKMKFLFVLFFVGAAVLLVSCGIFNNANRSKRNALVEADGTVINNAALGAIINAAVGGSTGYIIGKKMDTLAQNLKICAPDAKVERVEEGIIIELSSKLMFGLDQFSLTDSSKEILNGLIIILNEYPETNIEIQGHTDNTGMKRDNMTLSVRRATSAANYLKAHGVAASRVSAKGFGRAVPQHDNSTPEGREQNGRVEILIIANQQMKAAAAREARQAGIRG